MEKKIRMLLTRHPLDGHEAGYNILATGLREHGIEVIIELIESIACDIPRSLVVDVLNDHEYVLGIPKDVAVEIHAMVSARGIQGIRTHGLPRHILARIFHDRIGPMEMELAAYEQGSRELLLHLILVDPFTKSIDQANALLNDILALPYHAEMRQDYK